MVSLVQCVKCGFSNNNTDSICIQCGNDLSSTIVQSNTNQINLLEHKRTKLLTIVLLLNYLQILLLTVASILMVFYLLIGESPSFLSFDRLTFLLLSIIIPVLTIFFFWLTYLIQHYNNTARIVMVLCYAIDFLYAIFSLDPITLPLAAFVLFVLLFDTKTGYLFENPKKLNM